MPGTAEVVAFGCKVSQVEAQSLRARGLIDCDVVLHTCTVTETAAREALSLARRLSREGRRIRITGCAAATHRAEFAAIPGVVGVTAPRDSPPFPATAGLAGRTRAFLKLQDGCDLNCSFCVIPKVRGGSVERPFDDALAEARRLADAGHHEIVLTGIHLGGFRRIPDLVDRMPDVRIRLSSIEIHEVTDAILDLMPHRLCPHLHVPLQSGDAAVLRAMRRRYNPDQFLRGVNRIRSRVPEIGLTTDVITGFPGETRDAFDRTLDLCRRAGFHRIHGFSYSPRRGTDAAALPDDVPRREKRARIEMLTRLAAARAAEFARSLDHATVLVEADGEGYTEHYLRARAAGRPGDLVTGNFRDGSLCPA